MKYAFKFTITFIVFGCHGTLPQSKYFPLKPKAWLAKINKTLNTKNR